MYAVDVVSCWWGSTWAYFFAHNSTLEIFVSAAFLPRSEPKYQHPQLLGI